MFITRNDNCLLAMVGWESCCECNEFLTDLFLENGISRKFVAEISDTTGEDLLLKSLIVSNEKVVNNLLHASKVNMKGYSDQLLYEKCYEGEVIPMGTDVELVLEKQSFKPNIYLSSLSIKALECCKVTGTIQDDNETKEFCGNTNETIPLNLESNSKTVTIRYTAECDLTPLVEGRCYCYATTCKQCHCDECALNVTKDDNNNIYPEGGLKCDFASYLCAYPHLVAPILRTRAAIYLMDEAIMSDRCNPSAEDKDKLMWKLERLSKEYGQEVKRVGEQLTSNLHDDCCISCGGLQYVENVPTSGKKIFETKEKF